MEKALEFLENHVQWLAVGLGGLVLAWALYAYVLMSPVEQPAAAGQTALHPGNVDDWVSKTYAKPLSDDLNNTAAIDAPATSKQNPQEAFLATVKGPPTPPANLPVVAFNAPRSDVKLDDKDRGPDKGADLVEALPTLPSAPIVDSVPRRAYVGPAPANAAAVAGGAVPPPVTPPVVDPAANPGAALPPGHDLSYVRVTYSVPVDLIAKAFTDVKVPQTLSTGVTAIKLMRQEKQPDGTWGPPVEVPLPKTGVIHQPLPPDNGNDPTVYTTFRTWADSAAGQTDLLRPIFYPIVFGEGPWDPAMEDQMPAFDPEADRKARVAKLKEEAEKRRQANPPRTTTPRTPRTPRGGGGGGGDAPGMDDPQRPADVGGVIRTQAAPMNPDTPVDPGTTAVPPVQQPIAPGAGLPPADAIASPSFVPAQSTVYSAWAYDETVVEGHVYRYQVLYALRSPVFDSNLTKPPELARAFTLWSKLDLDDKKWGAEVLVKPSAEYFIATNNWQQGRIPQTISIDVYKWANGKWQSQQFKVAPGDEIGDDIAGVKYGTGTTVVDLRFDPRGGPNGRSYVLLLTPDGQLLEREPTVDRNNPNMLRLKGAIEAAKNGLTPGQPGNNVPPPLPGGGQPVTPPGGGPV